MWPHCPCMERQQALSSRLITTPVTHAITGAAAANNRRIATILARRRISTFIIVVAVHSCAYRLEGEPRTQLNLSPWRRHLCNRTETRGIYKTVWRSEIRVIERIEEFSTGFKMHCLPQRKATHHTYIYRLHCRSNHRVPRSIPECISRWRSKGGWIEPRPCIS